MVSFSMTGLYTPVIGFQPKVVALGDLNSDGRLDIVVISSKSGSIGVFLGYGNGSFATMTNYSTGEGSLLSAVTIADFNNDGRLDIAVTDSGTNNIGILFGYG